MWLLILTIIIFNSMFLFMPKKLTSIEIFSTCMFVMVLQQLVDDALYLKIDWYGYFFSGLHWSYLIIAVGVYPAVNAIFLNYYQFMKRNITKFLYIVGWSVFAEVYEYLAVLSGLFYHHQWKFWYSAIAYPILFLILLFVLNLVRRMVHKAICYQ